MMNDRSFQDFPSYIQKPSSKSKFTVIFVALFVIGVVILAGLYVVGGMSKKEAKKVAPVPTRIMSSPAPTLATQTDGVTLAAKEKSSPTLSPKDLERESLKVAILNGSGIPGAAKQISSHLNSLGYNITIIGNANEFNYKGFTIKLKKTKQEYMSLLKKDIAEKASTSATIETSIDDTISTDAEVIVGK